MLASLPSPRFGLATAAALACASALAPAAGRGVRPAPQGPELKVTPQTSGEVAAHPTASASAYNPNLNYWTPTAYTNGKVFFNMNGGSYQCSAAIVNTEGKDTVWTAGHC